jgi:hypothetical protein
LERPEVVAATGGAIAWEEISGIDITVQFIIDLHCRGTDPSDMLPLAILS